MAVVYGQGKLDRFGVRSFPSGKPLAPSARPHFIFIADAMHHAELTESVRRRITLVFAQMGDPSASELRESILIRDGNYCGRRFEASTGHAVWFVEENQLKFYDAAGAVFRVLAPEAGECLPARMAA